MLGQHLRFWWAISPDHPQEVPRSPEMFVHHIYGMSKKMLEFLVTSLELLAGCGDVKLWVGMLHPEGTGPHTSFASILQSRTAVWLLTALLHVQYHAQAFEVNRSWQRRPQAPRK